MWAHISSLGFGSLSPVVDLIRIIQQTQAVLQSPLKKMQWLWLGLACTPSSLPKYLREMGLACTPSLLPKHLREMFTKLHKCLELIPGETKMPNNVTAAWNNSILDQLAHCRALRIYQGGEVLDSAMEQA